MASLVLPPILGLLIALVAWPMVGALERRGVRRGIALASTIAVVLAVVLLAAGIVALSVGELVVQIPVYETRLSAALAGCAIRSRNSGSPSIPPRSARSCPREDLRVRQAGRVGGLRGRRLDAGRGVHGDLRARGQDVVPVAGGAFGEHHPLVRGMAEFGSDVRRYMIVRTELGLFAAVLSLALLLALGVPLPVLWGSSCSSRASSRTSAPSSRSSRRRSWRSWTAGSAGRDGDRRLRLINFVQDQFLQPVVMGSQLNLSPLVVFIALVVWAWILGPAGALLAVPLTLGLVTVLEAFPSSVAFREPVPQQDRVERRDRFMTREERPPGRRGSEAIDGSAEPTLSRRAIVGRAAVLVGILVVVFGIMLPRLVDYEAVRAAVAALTPWQVALLGVTSLVAYVANGPYRVLVPGLSWLRAVGSDLAARAVVSTVPGPTDAATRFVLYRQWSIPTDAASAGIGLAALFETLSCFALPLIAFPGLIVLDHPTRSKAIVLALIGLAVLVAAAVLLVSLVRSEDLARRIGGWLEGWPRASGRCSARRRQPGSSRACWSWASARRRC